MASAACNRARLTDNARCGGYVASAVSAMGSAKRDATRETVLALGRERMELRPLRVAQ